MLSSTKYIRRLAGLPASLASIQHLSNPATFDWQSFSNATSFAQALTYIGFDGLTAYAGQITEAPTSRFCHRVGVLFTAISSCVLVCASRSLCSRLIGLFPTSRPPSGRYFHEVRRDGAVHRAWGLFVILSVLCAAPVGEQSAASAVLRDGRDNVLLRASSPAHRLCSIDTPVANIPLLISIDCGEVRLDDAQSGARRG